MEQMSSIIYLTAQQSHAVSQDKLKAETAPNGRLHQIRKSADVL